MRRLTAQCWKERIELLPKTLCHWTAVKEAVGVQNCAVPMNSVFPMTRRVKCLFTWEVVPPASGRRSILDRRSCRRMRNAKMSRYQNFGSAARKNATLDEVSVKWSMLIQLSSCFFHIIMVKSLWICSRNWYRSTSHPYTKVPLFPQPSYSLVTLAFALSLSA